MEKIKRFMNNEGGQTMLEASTVLGFVAAGLMLVLFIVNIGGLLLGA